MSREGEARRPALLEPPKRSPHPPLLPTMSRPCCLPCLSAVCRSAATASPPVRAADAHSTACQGRAGGEAEEWGRACLSLDTLCYTWAATRRQRRKKGVKGLDFGLYIIHVLVGTYDLLSFTRLNGQTSRRGLPIHFPRYQLQREEDCTEFQAALLALLKKVPLHTDTETLVVKHWLYFYERCIGCVGVLKDWLLRAVSATVDEGSDTLTLERVQEHALSISQCE
jgi:hypothetical protein